MTAEAVPSQAVRWEFDISGMDCGDCAKTIEAGIRRLPGVAEADVNFGAATLTVLPAGDRLSRGAVLAAVARAGYRAAPRGDDIRVVRSPWWRTRRVIETAVAAILWVIGFAIEHTGGPIEAAAVPFAAAMVVAGYPVARAAWYAVKARRADMNVLMTIAAVGAVAIGEWDEGSSVLILFAAGLTLQTLTLDRTRRAIQALLRVAPRDALVRRDGRDERIPIDWVITGDVVIVLPGERIPVDGVVLTGHSVADQAPITGESMPVEIAPGSTVFAASINGDGALTVRVTRPGNDSTFARIVHLVEQAQGSRAPAQAFVDRFAAIYTPIVVAAALLLATAVPAVAGDWRDWIFRALVLLVVACPCALVISTPVALVAAIGAASRRGVLFKGGAAIEALAAIRTVAFDKTGTLTAGHPHVEQVVPFGDLTDDELLKVAAAIERGSSHPIAAGIVDAARRRSIEIPEVTDASSLPGLGARGRVNGVEAIAGSQRLFPNLPAAWTSVVQQLEAAGMTTVLVGTSERVLGAIGLTDPVRAESSDAVARLHRAGISTSMLTGDHAAVADRIASTTGVQTVHAGLLPEDKVAVVQKLQATGPVAMIGDGVNDAPALATANVGIAMGVAGTDVAIEAADVTLMADEIGQLPVAIDLAQRTLAVIRQNIVLAMSAKAAFLVLTMLGVTNLWLAVLADMGMSLVVTLNALRLARVSSRNG